LTLKPGREPLPPAMTGIFATAWIPPPFRVIVTVVKIGVGAGTVTEGDDGFAESGGWVPLADSCPSWHLMRRIEQEKGAASRPPLSGFVLRRSP
jgi:hypothetical protein